MDQSINGQRTIDCQYEKIKLDSNVESKTLKLLEEKNVGYYYNIKEGNKVQDVHTKQKGKHRFIQLH